MTSQHLYFYGHTYRSGDKKVNYQSLLSGRGTKVTAECFIDNDVLKKERKGEYLGSTIQVIPHVTDEIKRFIYSDLNKEDIVIYEIGGTLGDIES